MKKDIQCAVLEKIKKPLKIKNLNFRNLKYGQVLVKIIFSGICKTQLLEIAGARGKDRWLPHALGHEGSGIVEAVGKGVTKVKRGDEVILTWIKSLGIDSESPKFYSENKIINAGKITTFSNYSVISENRIVKKPKNMPMDIAALFGCAIPTGMGMILNNQVHDKKNVYAVVGVGGVGFFSILALKALGFKKIIAIDNSNDKNRILKKMKIKHVLNNKKKDFNERINAISKNGVDVCYEATGTIQGIELGFSILNKKKGKLIFASHPISGKKIKLDPHELISGKTIAGTWGGNTNPDRDIKKYFKILDKSKINLKNFVKIYSFKDINQALIKAKENNSFRTIIKMSHLN